MKRQRNLKYILLNERRLLEKTANCMIQSVWHSWKGKTMETRKRSVMLKLGRRGERKGQSKENV